ncbi:MAG: lipopolysaccharide heptosyltransferase I [Legionella sp.]|nr:MAG: lipopolysaccharide heptosyltransferase I [Legionella sp.]
MKKILLVKLTSMGDLIQMLPALTDAAKAIPGIQFDWLADESFQEIPAFHPSVQQIITIPYRKSKKNLQNGKLNWNDVKQFWRKLRAQRYDMVIDAQSNIKSALVTLLAKGKKYGLDKTSVREYGAQFAYSETITISRQQNHAQRMRELLATFLNYPLPNTEADYGIVKDNLPALQFDLPEKFVFVTHICSSPIKLWPESYWAEVIRELLNSGYEVVMPWWSDEEKARTLRLKNNDSRVHAIPPLNLPEKASVLVRAKAAISLDTGLSHMAAALDVPNISLYGPTTSETSGAFGVKQIHLSATGPTCRPCLRTQCHYSGPSEFKPACMETIKPAHVLKAFAELGI